MTDFKSQYNASYVELLANKLASIQPKLNVQAFREAANHELETMEMKARSAHIMEAIKTYLPGDIEQQIQVLVDALAPYPDESDTPDPWQGFRIWPWTMFVAKYGLETPETSLHALYQMTQRFTAEFAIQPFLQSHRTYTLSLMAQWVTDPNKHIRRLVSEGTRTRLPWGKRMEDLIDDFDQILPMLAQLKDDPEDYVYRSVANNFNDLTKTHPDMVVEILTQWHNDAPTPQRLWLIKHALRTLIKAGHPGALSLMGFDDDITSISLTTFACDETVSFGQTLSWSMTICSTSAQAIELLIDFRIDFLGSRDQLRPKVFKWKTLTIKPDESITLKGRFTFKSLTTRKYYNGAHQIEALINGNGMGVHEFVLDECPE